MDIALFWARVLYFTKYLISSLVGSSAPPKAGMGLVTFSVLCCSLTSPASLLILILPTEVNMLAPMLDELPPPTLYFTYKVLPAGIISPSPSSCNISGYLISIIAAIFLNFRLHYNSPPQQN